MREAIPACPVHGKDLTGRRRSAFSRKCRAAASQRQRKDALALMEEQPTRALAWVSALRRSKVTAQGRESGIGAGGVAEDGCLVRYLCRRPDGAGKEAENG